MFPLNRYAQTSAVSGSPGDQLRISFFNQEHIFEYGQDHWLDQMIQKQIIEFFSDREFIGGQIDVSKSWSVDYGWGSSSALFLSLYFALERFHYPSLNWNQLQQKCRSNSTRLLEVLLASQGGGSGADLACQMLGEACMFQNGDTQALELKAPEDLLLIHTGEKFNTREKLLSVKRREGPIKKIENSTREFLKQLNSGPLTDQAWVRAMEQHFSALEELNVVPLSVVNQRQDWLDKSWIRALKTSGAGGGDSLICLINQQHKRELINEIEQLNWEYTFPVELGTLSGETS